MAKSYLYCLLVCTICVSLVSSQQTPKASEQVTDVSFSCSADIVGLPYTVGSIRSVALFLVGDTADTQMARIQNKEGLTEAQRQKNENFDGGKWTFTMPAWADLQQDFNGQTENRQKMVITAVKNESRYYSHSGLYRCLVNYFDGMSFKVKEKEIQFPMECPFGWIKYAPGKTCVYLSQHEVDHSEARSACTKLNAKLVKIEDSSMNSFLQGLVSDIFAGGYFIGLNDMKEEGRFVWNVEKSQAPYTNWSTGQPDGNACCNCVLIHSNGRWHDSPCDYRHKFICQKSIVPTIAPPTTKCPAGWVTYDAGKTCFEFVVSKKLDATGARKSCNSRGGDLVKIPDKATSNFIKETIRDSTTLKGKIFFIGLHDTDTERFFRWNNETTKTTFTNWSPGEPNDWKKVEDCVAIWTHRLWFDTDCSNKFPYICQKAPAL